MFITALGNNLKLKTTRCLSTDEWLNTEAVYPFSEMLLIYKNKSVRKRKTDFVY